MKKNKQKKDKELFRESFVIILGAVTLGTIVGTCLIYGFSTILSFELSFPIQIVLGFLSGGGTLGTTIGLSLRDALKNNTIEECIEYEEYELEDEKKIEDGFVQENVSTLKIVKGSGSNYSYKFNDNERPKLEIVNSDKKQTSKKR